MTDTTDTTDEQGHGSAPAVPESAVWLKGQLLEIAAALHPDRRPAVVREWTDPVRLRDPAPVGHRFFFLLCVGGDDGPSSPGFGDALNAFAAAGWTVRRQSPGHPGESWATARQEDFEVRIYEGDGRGIVTFTGWTPVVYTERHLPQPPFTLSTARGVLCDDCHGWGVCLDCEGRAYSGGSGGYGRCLCAANNAGPGRCVECGGSGLLTADEASWRRRQYGLPDAGRGDAVRQTPAEGGHDSSTSAFIDVSKRSCGCGEFRCFWRNILSVDGEHLLSRFVGTCQGCAAERSYTFALPSRGLAAPAVPPSPPLPPSPGPGSP
ncbi:hypothetical protein ABZY02_01725 [Streptomyces sp. NPDC006649]|uniref:hypothetical protein n=1 Tax=Streptomyces sp. NPDC006649 TaxID=3156896 RepID=UPI0033B4844E